MDGLDIEFSPIFAGKDFNWTQNINPGGKKEMISTYGVILGILIKGNLIC